MDQKTDVSVIRTDCFGVVYYGLRVTDNAGSTAEFPYISTVYQAAQRLCMRIAPADISMLHIGDIVADYLKELFFEALQRNGLSFYSA